MKKRHSKGKRDVDTIAYKNRQKFSAIGGFLESTTVCFSFYADQYSLCKPLSQGSSYRNKMQMSSLRHQPDKQTTESIIILPHTLTDQGCASNGDPFPKTLFS
jgi:hypothetical protein